MTIRARLANRRRRTKNGDLKPMLAALLVVAAGLVVAPAARAAEWGHYVNERFGVEADVPPGFEPGEAPANGDGLEFSTPTARLAIYASPITEDDFESAVARRMGWATEAGWAITYQASTPGWATWSGARGSRILYARAIRMCGGTIIGAFELDYSQVDRTRFDPVVNRLVGSLRDSGTGWQC